MGQFFVSGRFFGLKNKSISSAAWRSITLCRVLHGVARFLDLLAGLGRALIEFLADLLGWPLRFLAAIEGGNQGARSKGKTNDRHEFGDLDMAILHAGVLVSSILLARVADARNALRPSYTAFAWSRCLPNTSSLSHLVANNPAHGRAADRADAATA